MHLIFQLFVGLREKAVILLYTVKHLGLPQVLRLLMKLLDRAWKSSIRKDSNLLVLLCKEAHPSDKLTLTSMVGHDEVAV